MNILVIVVCVFTLLILRFNGVANTEWKPTREDVREIEKHIQLQNNTTVVTIRTRHGEIYDCVNYYKQPAFDHPLLKNHKFIPQKNPTLSRGKARNNVLSIITPKLELNGKGCPDGTVPIKRVTKEDLIRDKLAQANDDSYYAKCFTPKNWRYTGASATLAVYNPEVNASQYSAAKMKLQIGPDSIEAGWRVDPTLYNDNQSRLYIRTDTRNIHCFNTFCPGFILTQNDIPLDYAFDTVSTPGGDKYGVDISITGDGTGGWILKFTGNTEIGRWPAALFEQPGIADYIEWGGEVFAPKGSLKPGMGAGTWVEQDTSKDAYYSNVKVEMDGNYVDPIKLTCKAQLAIYQARDEGNVGGGLQYLIFYGGPIGYQ